MADCEVFQIGVKGNYVGGGCSLLQQPPLMLRHKQLYLNVFTFKHDFCENDEAIR